MDVFKSGIVFNPDNVQSASGRFPIVDVFNLGDALPAGPYVYLSPQQRDGFNQGGDGVDWHPTLNEVVAAVGSDIPAVGTAGRSSLQGAVLAVFATGGIPPFIRKLTNPVGQADAFFDVSTLIASTVAPNDYAPAVSPDGTRVAYVRHFLRQDTPFSVDGATSLTGWGSLGTFTAAGVTHLITITPDAGTPFAFYRVRL